MKTVKKIDQKYLPERGGGLFWAVLWLILDRLAASDAVMGAYWALLATWFVVFTIGYIKTQWVKPSEVEGMDE